MGVPPGRPVTSHTLLVLRALKLGDLLVAVPALHALRRAFPDHRLVYAGPAWLADVLELVGGFEMLPTKGLEMPLAVAPGTVDIAVNLHGRGPESTSLLEALGARPVDYARAQPAAGRRGWSEMHERERWTHLLRWHGIDADPLDVRLSRPMPSRPVESSTPARGRAARRRGFRQPAVAGSTLRGSRCGAERRRS